MAKFLSTTRDIPAVSLIQLFPNCTQADLDKLISVAQDSAEGLQSNAIPVRAIYGSSTAIDTSDYNDFPKGSYIIDAYGATPSIYLKTGATTWKSQAINT